MSRLRTPESSCLEHRGIAKSAALLRRLLAAGRSRFEPDPIAALEAAEQVRDA